MNVSYFKAGTTYIRSFSLAAVIAVYPSAEPISREEAAAHDAKGGAIQWVLN